MWRNLLCPVKMGVKVLTARAVQNGPKIARTVVLMSSMHVVNIEDDGDIPVVPPVDPDELNLPECPSDVKLACVRNDEAIHNLIETLNMCICEICDQYQDCVARQIEIILICMSLSPLGKHWDDLTKYRVEADELKLEFEKYGMLVQRIGTIIHNHAIHSESINESCERGDTLHGKYEILKRLIQQKEEENRYWDSKLLDVNRRSILNVH